MAQEPDIDPNLWYSMFIDPSHTQSMVGTALYNGDGSRGAVFIKTRNDTDTEQRWQLRKFNSTVWTLRSQGSGPNSYLSAKYSDDEQQKGKSFVYMARGDIADASAYWTIASWGDGTWYLINLANKTDYHLTLTPNLGHIVMSSNITAPQKGQKWNFSEIAVIDDERYSSVNVRYIWVYLVQSNISPVSRWCDRYSNCYLRTCFIFGHGQSEREHLFRHFYWRKSRYWSGSWRCCAHSTHRTRPFPLAETKERTVHKPAARAAPREHGTCSVSTTKQVRAESRYHNNVRDAIQQCCVRSADE